MYKKKGFYEKNIYIRYDFTCIFNFIAPDGAKTRQKFHTHTDKYAN